MNNVSLVTGLWDIGRNQLSEGWSRSYQHYLDKFSQLLSVKNNMIIFGDNELKKFVFERRSEENTQFILRDSTWFKNNDYYDKIQSIRNNPNWQNQSGWLKDSTQCKLEMYNPLVMSKMFLLHDAKIMDKFNSEYLFWIDAGLTNTVHQGYFTSDLVLDKLSKYINKFSFICFPYDGKVEIHGFNYNKLCELSNDLNVNKVARAGFFGGPKESISYINGVYYSLMYDTLSSGFMGTEESLFTIMCYKYPELIDYFQIESNGLLGKFFEDLKNDNLVVKSEKKGNVSYNLNNTALYVLTYNSPQQFEKLCMSFELYDKNFLDKPKKYLINNSLDKSKFDEYDKLCEKYGFEEIHKDNIGICGGRQFIAEHSDENNFDFHFFFEDDMFFYLGEDEFCRNGFRRKIKNFYNIMLDIINIENFDFLKWNFSEFFGDNSKQWAWHNVPQDVRERLFPERPRKSENDTGKEPYLKYRNIKSHKSVPYATGEIFYCNWPQVVTKEGNKKMFINTKWVHPYEQTWMSYIYQQTVEGNINPGILLATPTEHNRFYHYSKEERREN